MRSPVNRRIFYGNGNGISQRTALQRVLEARGEAVRVVDVDATTDEQLVLTYHVLTVPSTVILDAAGNAHAVNYGFANTQRLLQQVDEMLAQTSAWNTAS